MTARKYIDDYIHLGHRRRLMQALRNRGITDESVLAAMGNVPRHWFVGQAIEGKAYEDRALPIAKSQTISQPYTVALQSSWLETEPRQKVLEIGTGSGYQAAVLATMGLYVYTLERQEDLFIKTNTFFRQQRFGMIRCFLQDGFKGLPAYGPYDRILVTAAAATVPATLLAQLTIGGKMIIPVGEQRQVMQRITRIGEGDYRYEALGNFKFVPFIEGIEPRSPQRSKVK